MGSPWDFFVTPAYADWQTIQPQGVAYTESRGMTRQQKNTPGIAGEIGTYQMTPIAFRDLQRLNPEYKKKNFYDITSNDDTARQAMIDYMKVLQTNYFQPFYRRLPSDAELLQMYNVGPTAYKKGVRNPKYAETYQRGIRGR